MKIAILTHNYPKFTGQRVDAGSYIFFLADTLVKRGHQVFIFSPDFEGEKENFKKVPVTWFKWLGGNKKLGNMNLSNPLDILKLISMFLVGIIEAVRFARKNDVDFCLAVWVIPSGIFTLAIKIFLRIPIGVLAMGSDILVYTRTSIYRLIIQYLLKKADILFGDGIKVCGIVQHLSGRVCTYLPIITDISFQGIKPKRFSNDFCFLYVGRMEPVKGPDILIEAIKILKDENMKFNICLAGDGSLFDSLRSRVHELSLEENVEFLGNVSDKKKLAALFLGADSLVVPSRSDSLPMVVPEAAHAGLPAICTNVGDLGKLVGDNDMGLVVEPQNPQLLASAMIEAIHQGKNFKSSRNKNLSRVKKIFTLQNNANIFLGELRKCGLK